jgi:hypothetical protein
MRLGIMHQKILPHFQLRRDKRLIAHEVAEAAYPLRRLVADETGHGGLLSTWGSADTGLSGFHRIR